jgi:glycosyltransferase involved in cell wall biosynthesis
MRIVIDLQACQSGPRAVMDHTLALALALARTAGPHEVWLALNHHFTGTVEPLRLAFHGLVPPGRVVGFDLPGLGQQATPSGEWRLRAAEQIRAGFLAALNPDIVFAPHVLEAADPHVLSAAGAGVRRYLTAFLVADPALLDIPAPEQRYRLQASMQGAALLFTNSEAARRSLIDNLGKEPQQVVELALQLVDDAAAALWSAFAGALAARAAPASGLERARLAYVSPLPPEKSGIADYSAELIPELARYYDIDLVIDQPLVSDPWLKANLPLRTVAWFEAHADEYQHVLYHFGNSRAHQHMFALAARHPGIVVLHDFYLGNVLDYLDHSGYQPGAFAHALYRSHGLSALIDRQHSGATDAIWKYPCNKAVLDQAAGVIVHSRFPRQLAENWYGSGAADDWRTIPLVRGHAGAVTGRAAARTELNLRETDFVVCSFGMLGCTKRNDSVLDAWLASPLAADPRCRLIFVGENDGGPYGRALLQKIAASAHGKRISITGFVAHDAYCSYLAAADGAVQLRTQTRGETSASVLDCMLHGVATIVNAHGSLAELPDTAVLKLEDAFAPAALIDAITGIWRDPALRLRLSLAARDHMRAEHAPAHVGRLYRDAIEYFGATSQKQHYRRLVRAVSRIGTQYAPAPDDLVQAAAAIAANLPAVAPRQLLVDISAMVQSDLKTGIQRVVRSILAALLKNPPPGYRVEPVYGIGQGYRYARRYTQESMGCAVPGLDDAPIELRAGDLFLGLDLFMHGTHQNHALLQQYRERGAQVYFIVFDILPVLRPDVFPAGSEADFSAWLHTVSTVADGLVCISRAVADQLAHWLAAHPVARSSKLNIGSFHLGADIQSSAPSFGLPPGAEQILERVGARPSLIMVGTLEPRKAHAQALAAFEILWAEGIDVNLVIVGKHGWMVDDVAARLSQHPENGTRLFWLPGVSDEMLLQLYQASAGLLAASEGEGFGLPLIEAAQHRLPIIARSLPVFREVIGEHAYYFDGLTPAALADAMRTWLELLLSDKVPQSSGMHWLTWEESAVQLLDAIYRQQWRHEIVGSSTATGAFAP